MEDPDRFDPAWVDLSLFGGWPEGAAGLVFGCEGLGALDGPRLEVKSLEGRAGSDGPEGPNGLVGLLNDLTLEMREQFDLHRRLRASAETWLVGEGASEGTDGGEPVDGAAAKAARADVKAVTDAMQAIVRTLEKIDTLQRQLARDRMDADERSEAESDGELEARIEALIEARAAERARALLAAARHGGDDGRADLAGEISVDAVGAGAGGATAAGDGLAG